MAAAMSSIRRSVSGEPCLRQQQRRQQAGLWCCITIAVMCWVAACSHRRLLHCCSCQSDTLTKCCVLYIQQCYVQEYAVTTARAPSVPLLSSTLAEGLLAGHGAWSCGKLLASRISGFFELNENKVNVCLDSSKVLPLFGPCLSAPLRRPAHR